MAECFRNRPTGFLSEMSAEPVHGGGVTLARILGDDLGRFNWVAKTLHFDGGLKPDYGPTIKSFAYQWWSIERYIRRFIGCSRAFKISHHPIPRTLFAKSVARHLLKNIPEIFESRVLVCPQADISLRVMNELRKHCPMDYVTWMMDDHLVKWNHGVWDYPCGLDSQMQDHLRHAQHVFVISDTMRDFYAKRFGVDSTVLHAPAEFTRQVSGNFNSDKVRLVYFGTIGPWQSDAIELLIPAMDRGVVALDVYTMSPEFMTKSLVKSGAICKSPVGFDQVQATIAKYDAVLLPISFSAEKRNMSYFNIATKFSECLGSGVPTLLIGPAYSAMVKIAQARKAAIIVEHPDESNVYEALSQLRDHSKRQRVLEAAESLVQNFMSREVMRSRWESGWNATKPSKPSEQDN